MPDRWLAKVKADALREASYGLIDWDVIYGHEVGTAEQNESHKIAGWLNAEADRIEDANNREWRIRTNSEDA